MAGASSSSTAINIPFTFVGCSAPSLSSTASAPFSSSLLGKGGSGLLVRCPPRSQRVTVVVRLSRPCRLTRLIVRNSGSVFLAVRSAPSPPSAQQLDERSADGSLAASAVAAVLDCCPSLVVPEHQLCAADVWRDSLHSAPLPPSLVRVHTFPSAGPMRGSFSPQLAESTTAALCVQLRGAEDEWSRDAKLGLSWLEVFGVPVEQ